jgi:hypothetical protein
MTGHGDTHLAAWQAASTPAEFDAHAFGPATSKAREIARRLEAAMPGRRNDLPTPVKKGTRCSITAGGITATGTIRCSYTAPEPIAFVTLDGTGDTVDVPWNLLGKDQA